VQPAGTDCRPAVDECDVLEECTGTALQTCPANGFAPASTSCDADSSVCTIDECDGGGNCVFDSNVDCDDGNTCSQDSCDANNGCEHTGTPSAMCQQTGTKALLKLKDSDPSSSAVKFLWKGGPVLIDDLGDPTQPNGTRYELCIYDSQGVRSFGVPPQGGWSTIGKPSNPKGYKFKDPAGQFDGIRLIKVKAGTLDKAKLKVSGKGSFIPADLMLPLNFTATAQLYASDGACWQAEFENADTKRNDSGAYTGKTTTP
jgi:hypothetical protein